jgi:hypothetical protein
MIKHVLFAVMLITVINSLQAQNNIIGGVEININTIPWQVSLENAADNNNHFCGASIINERWLLTAAHCITLGQNNPALITVHAGASNQTNNTVGQRIACDQVFIHPQYNGATAENDIALLRLSVPLQLNANVQTVRYSTPCNTTNAMLAPGQVGALTGWGRTCNSCPISPTLRRIDIPIIDNAQAMQIQLNNNTAFTRQISGNMIPFFQNGSAAAPGDSGGPATIWDANNNPIVIGVCSWGYAPKEQNPTVYTRVRNYTQWIETTTGLVEGLNNATIAGPNEICAMEQYVVNDIMPGTTVQWQSIPAGVVSFGSPGLPQTSVTRLTTGTVTLRATLTSPCGGVRIIERTNILVGGPTTLFVTAGQNGCTDVGFSVSGGNFSNFQWTVIGGDILFNGNATSTTTVGPHVSATGTSGGVSVSATNSCGATVTGTTGYSRQFPPALLSIEPYIPYPEANCYETNAFYFLQATHYGQPPLSYEWGYRYNGGPDVILSGNSYIQQFFFMQAGTYELFVRPRNECVAGSDVVKTIQVYDQCIFGPPQPRMASTPTIKLIPNPSQGQLAVELGSATGEFSKVKGQILKLTVYDKLGGVRKVLQYKGGQSRVQADLSGLPDDVYIVEVFDGKNTIRKILLLKR